MSVWRTGEGPVAGDLRKSLYYGFSGSCGLGGYCSTMTAPSPHRPASATTSLGALLFKNEGLSRQAVPTNKQFIREIRIIREIRAVRPSSVGPARVRGVTWHNTLYVVGQYATPTRLVAGS